MTGTDTQVRYDLTAEAKRTDKGEDLFGSLACLASPASVPVCRNKNRAAGVRGELGMVLGVSYRLSVFHPPAASSEDRRPASGLWATRNDVVVSDQQARCVRSTANRQLPTKGLTSRVTRRMDIRIVRF